VAHFGYQNLPVVTGDIGQLVCHGSHVMSEGMQSSMEQPWIVAAHTLELLAV